MLKAKTQPLTRQKSNANYGGGPSELSKTEPSIYTQSIRYYITTEKILILIALFLNIASR